MIESKLKEIDDHIDEMQFKVVTSFRKYQVSEIHLHASTGYGYDDLGRDTLEKIFAELFGAESALVRPNIIPGPMQLPHVYMGCYVQGTNLYILQGNHMIHYCPLLGTERMGLVL